MSWMKRRGPGNPSPASTPPVQMYNPNTHSTTENQWQQPQTWYNPNTAQQQFPQATQQQPANQPQSGDYWQQPYANPTQHQQAPYNQNNQQYGQQFQEQTGYYQNNGGFNNQQVYDNLQYNQQQYNQNNVYPAQTKQQNEGDAWNWGWGDEDNSNVQTQAQQRGAVANNTAQENNIGESFSNIQTWNWSLDDKSTNQIDPNIKQEPNINELFPKVAKPHKRAVKSEVEPEVNRLVVRGKLDTPQWSTESQMSQESSDDVLHTSESDKSHMISRSSTSHSPISGQESLQQNSDENSVKNENSQEHGASSLQQFENKEIVGGVKQEVPENRPVKVNPTPPPPVNTQTPPLLPPQGSSDDLNNPYKRTAGLSHKSASKFRSTNITPPDSRQNSFLPPFHNQTVNLETLPDNSEHPDNIPSANPLKTEVKPVQQWPDNNEAPINDRNQYLETGQLSDANLGGYAGISGDVSVKQEVGDTLPPPGLRRMVPGQLEQNESGAGLVNFGDEPPPGLSRLVLGQTESGSAVPLQSQEDNLSLPYEPSGPPEGLHRMVPGESSSPENSLRQPRREENDSESELDRLTRHTPQPRSATIGADTPPTVQNPAAPSQQLTNPTVNAQATVNRSETIGGDLEVPASGQAGQDSNKTRASSNESRVNNRKNAEKNRRDSIEGQTQENELSHLTNSIRNLTVGENLTDGQNSTTSLRGSSPRRLSQPESSDSDREQSKMSRNIRDKRSMEKPTRQREKESSKHRGRDLYSPDNYRDKRDRKDKRYRERRYEEDTDNCSDKEKDRRVRDERDRDYERKYSSLRKDKDKKRKGGERDLRGDYHRDSRRGDYYYSRYENDYDNENRSRPSSRSDSMHESYRERRHDRAEHRDRRPKDRDKDRERERYRHHRGPRESFNPYQGYAYDPYNPYYQQYQYYENLRRTNPQAYAEWYRKYYQQATGSNASFAGEDRASVHSGRSSANDELAKDSYSRPFDQTDNSLLYEEQNEAAQRLTPSKFATAHIKASISSGKLLRIQPTYPMDGQNAVADICNLNAFLENDEESRELSQFPGPLAKGVTHKKTIIEYCESKIRDGSYNRKIVDVDSYILMWELLILLIRQNGMVVGTDIAELLLKNRNNEAVPPRPSSVISSISSINGDVNQISEASNQPLSENTSLQSVVKEEAVTNKFREYLLYGSGKEALEWAMKHGLWGHALFLASKLDKRTYANVMMRFANGLTLNDPLQTLYQLLSGKMPAAVTCVSDEKWGDWRPHLAMILSNSTHRPELNCKAITTLGDTLMSRGSLYAAQFCYLMAQVGFGKHDDPETRLALLGSDHSKPFAQFATNEAIYMTEIYEYACSLNDQEFVIPEFQIYKYLLATRLADRGLLEKALLYLEKLSSYIVGNPSIVSRQLVDHVFNLADKLKFYDPVGDVMEDETEFGGMMETNRPDNSWLKDLRAVQNDYQNGLIMQETVNNLAGYQPTSLDADMTTQQQSYDPNQQDVWQQQQQYDQPYQQNVPQQPWQPEQQQVEYQPQENIQQQSNDFSATQYQDQQNYWPNQQQQQQWGGDQVNQYEQENVDQQQNFYGSSNAQTEDGFAPSLPQISMPNRSQSNKNAYDEAPAESPKKPSPVKPKPQSPLLEKTQSTGWFGGIFSKLALRPKNQMKLPEDKNPKIVWDQDKKRWVNMDEDTNDPANEFKPPPKMADMMPKMPPAGSFSHPGSATPATILPVQTDAGKVPDRPAMMSMPNVPTQNEDAGNPITAASQPNMFKMHKRGRNLKNSYVDVFNPSGKPMSGPTSLPGPDSMPSMAGSQRQMNFFIPQPVNDPNAPTDFLTPAPLVPLGEQQSQ